MKKTIDVVYASNDGYWRYMATSMLSAMKTAWALVARDGRLKEKSARNIREMLAR